MRRSYKSDESFLEKLASGAIGTKRVIEDLKQKGHQPIELERGSTSFKIWKEIKIKRIRVPDILCVKCGNRIESRAKTQFEVSMSHSPTDPERSWDYGLRDEDAVAIVICRKIGNRPIDWEADPLVQYVKVKDMREARQHGHTIQPRAKGAEEGFEMRIVWPTVIASFSGVVTHIEPNKIVYQRTSDRRTLNLRLMKQKQQLQPLVKIGDTVQRYQAIAAVMPITHQFRCDNQPKDVQSYLNQMKSLTLSERYSAVKALAMFATDHTVITELEKHVDKEDEHVFIRLEAAAALARAKRDIGLRFIEQCLQSEYLSHRLEAIIVLSEINHDWSRKQLTKILQDRQQPADIRAGAAWALGEINDRQAIPFLIETFSELQDSLRAEAARALVALLQLSDFKNYFSNLSSEQRAGFAWAMSRSKAFQLEEVLTTISTPHPEPLIYEDMRHWIAYMIGMQKPQDHVDKIELLKQKDQELYFAVTVLWKIMTSWIYQLEEY